MIDTRAPRLAIEMVVACMMLACTGTLEVIETTVQPPGSRTPATAPPAGVRSIEIHWSHPSPASVQSFRIYWGLAAGEYLAAETVDPRPEPDGTFLARLRVPSERTIHVSLTAFGPDGESLHSNRGVCEPGCRRARPIAASLSGSP